MGKRRRLCIFIIIFLLYSIMVAGVFYQAGYKSAYGGMESPGSVLDFQTFYASISDIQDHVLTVKGMRVNDINFRGDFVLSLTDETKIIWRGTDIPLDDLEVGAHIAVTFTGGVMESDPAQITQVAQIQALDDQIRGLAPAEEQAAEVTSEQVKKLTPSMTCADVIEALGDTRDIGSGNYILEYEVDGGYLLRISFAGDDAQLGTTGDGLLDDMIPCDRARGQKVDEG